MALDSTEKAMKEKLCVGGYVVLKILYMLLVQIWGYLLARLLTMRLLCKLQTQWHNHLISGHWSLMR